MKPGIKRYLLSLYNVKVKLYEILKFPKSYATALENETYFIN